MPSPLKSAVAATVLVTLASCGGYGNDNYYAYPAFTVPNSIAVADVNGDGVPDLLVATTLDQGLANNQGFANVILGQKTTPGTYLTGVQYPATGSDPSSIAVADLAGSGKLDLVVANFGTGSVTVYMHGATAGTFQTGVDVMTGGAPNQVAVGSLNGGNPDIVVADASAGGNVFVLFHDPANPGKFLAQVSLPTALTTTAVAIADLNGDGHPDIVATTYDSNGNSGAVMVFYQNASSPGTFAVPGKKFPAGAQPQAVRVAQLTAAALPDLVVANLGSGTDGVGSAGVSVLPHDPANPGSFLAPVTYATQGGAVDVAVGDLDGDGKPDLVVANLGPAPSGSVSVLLQNPASPGTFGAATNYTGFGQPLSVAIADLNGDGRPDIAVADSSTATVMLQSSSTAGTFAQPVQVGQ